VRLLLDADGCPVVDIAVRLAKKHGVECVIVCDDAHEFAREGASTVTVSKGPDSVDFALVNLAQSGDIVVTQDTGLAAMCLARNLRALNQDGQAYTDAAIDGLLMRRHAVKEQVRRGRYPKGAPKRKQSQDEAFEAALDRMLGEKTD